VTISLPDTDVVHALKAQVGWVLVNRNGPAIQPGTRSYARSWVRDGCLTSSALLRLGEMETVRQFIEWFAPYQFASGKSPCCVDERGADPVPEHDSSGELIYLIAEYVRLTGDRAFAEKMWPHVIAAAGYLDTLRDELLRQVCPAPTGASYAHSGLARGCGCLIRGRAHGSQPLLVFYGGDCQLRNILGLAIRVGCRHGAIGADREALILAACEPVLDGGRGGVGGRGRGQGATTGTELQAVQRAVDSVSPEPDTKATLAKLAEARKTHQAALQKAQDDLRRVITIKQEAVLTVSGYL